MEQRIALKINDQVKDLFSICYTSEGGFFFQDKIRLNSSQKTCHIIKMKCDCNHHGIATRKMDYSATTSGDLKFSHHLDGRSHISGNGVVSGYLPDGTPKGASIQSFKLTESNDTGAFFSILVWGYDFFRNTTKKSIVLTSDDRYVHSSYEGELLNGVVVKALYLLKEWLTPQQLSGKTLTCVSAVEGEVEVTLVPSTENCPGIIGLFASGARHGMASEFGFTMSGAPGKKDENGFCDNLAVLYPYQGKGKDVTVLDFIKE